MDNINRIAHLLYRFFATDQNYFAAQQDDGTYRKTSGLITAIELEKCIKKNGSLAIYQKNIDSTIKWICFDFDILKKHIGKESFNLAKVELNRAVSFFCRSLNELSLPYLLEFSGNRGFHIWITFNEGIHHRTGYEILQLITDMIDLKFDEELIGIDKFPKSKSPSDGVGSAVKIPLSKHTKSGFYSMLLENRDQIETLTMHADLSSELIESQINILECHVSMNNSELENTLGVFFDLSQDDKNSRNRIRSIQVNDQGFTIDELFEHWSIYKPLEKLCFNLKTEAKLNNDQRKLIVGLLNNIHVKTRTDFAKNILHQIFSYTENYSKTKTERAISELSSFYFPSQQQIEDSVGMKFDEKYTIDDLIKICIPEYKSHEDATFDLSIKDVEITMVAELNYLFQNDEAQSRIIINELSNGDSIENLQRINELITCPEKTRYYKHIRNEGDKTRTLISLGSIERVLTSSIIKQLIYFFDITPNVNSHGYRPNKGFNGGYIFQPWLYLWIKFLSNISSSIKDEQNQNFYIVKTDIKKFYDNIPHDNIKRMFLGGVNERIDAKLKTLTSDSSLKYKKLIHTLLEITASITNTNRGMPQGPAYARYFAEIYLDNVDHKLDDKIKNGTLLLYQRYVDDIFFITESEEDAKAILHELELELESIGLEINKNKTIITQIKNFSDDFNNYRSQSKYAVDRVSKNFNDATLTQKNLALSEFMKLVQSESCEEDLAFIFSHLTGVKQLDALKREQVSSTLISGIGRGSVYKHLFNFVIEDIDNWHFLEEVEKFTDLQSEILTSCMINSMENIKIENNIFKELIERIETKISRTRMVDEHLSYIYIKYGINVSIKNIEPEIIIRSIISATNIENLTVTHELIRHINTELNEIKNLVFFVEAIYPLCVSSKTSKEDLNNLSLTFYAKLAADMRNGFLSTDHEPEITTEFIAEKFYYLLCLFSISDVNDSPELLRDMWKYCANVYNKIEMSSNSHYTSNWLKKIGDINIHQPKALLIITAIIDGNLFRGLVDKKRVFEKFHNIILVFITMQQYLLDDEEITSALNSLKEKANFYDWLIENNDVVLFPEKFWFEKNIINNSTILLKKKNEILIRKPSNEFKDTNAKKNEHNGYSEIIEPYNIHGLYTVKEVLGKLTLKQRLDILLEGIDSNKSEEGLPNIFCNEKIVLKNSLNPFSDELRGLNTLIFQDQNGNVESLDNNFKNFILCFFKTTPVGDNSLEFKEISEKYIQNINVDINLLEFIRQISNQLGEIDGVESNFYYDIVIAAALYNSLAENENITKITKFVDQYHKFNPRNEDRHIYCVKSDMTLRDNTPIELLETVKISLELILTEVMPSLGLFLANDILLYIKNLQQVARLEDSVIQAIDLGKFRKSNHRISQISETISFDNIDYKFQDVKLLNIMNMTLQQLEPKHTVVINSSDHVYYYISDEIVYIVAIHHSISKIYHSIQERLNILNKSTYNKSYPERFTNRYSIESLNKFNIAIENISIHRDISIDESGVILIKWLSSLPKCYHQMLVSLISAHVVMNKKDIQDFLNQVESCLVETEINPFLIKRPDDYNGTYRILYRSDNLGRQIGRFNPINIKEGATQATIIVDNIITGSQIIKAIKYYIDNNNNDQNLNYFEYSYSEKALLRTRLQKLKQLNICTVFYTTKGIDNIKLKCNEIFNSEISINVVCGRCIDNDAMFGSTEKIGELEKIQIKEILADRELMRNLYYHLNCVYKSNKSYEMSEEKINKTNLVARYKSLPKKNFQFLQLGLKHNNECQPFVRIVENNE